MSFCYKFVFLEKFLTPGAGEDILLELEKVSYTFCKCGPRGVLADGLQFRMGRQVEGRIDQLAFCPGGITQDLSPFDSLTSFCVC